MCKCIPTLALAITLALASLSATPRMAGATEAATPRFLLDSRELRRAAVRPSPPADQARLVAECRRFMANPPETMRYGGLMAACRDLLSTVSTTTP